MWGSGLPGRYNGDVPPAVPEFLSDEWLSSLARRSESAGDDGARPGLVIQQAVTGTPDGEVAYVVHLGPEGVRASRGRSEGADISFTQDLATAEAIHRGEISAQAAFMAGRIRISGDLDLLARGSRSFAALAEPARQSEG
jgi:predicted lipid carrier protein YhbT